MRIKIALLTVAAINAIVFGGYWVLRLLYIEAMWFCHFTRYPHECKGETGEHILMFIMSIAAQVMMVGISALVLFGLYEFIPWCIGLVYKRIDKMFPEKKP